MSSIIVSNIVDLLLINILAALVFESGFWDTLDSIINERFGLGYHLPYIFQCVLCQVFWLSLLYIIITGNLSLLTIVLCLVNAHLIKITIPIIKMIENFILKIIESINIYFGL